MTAWPQRLPEASRPRQLEGTKCNVRYIGKAVRSLSRNLAKLLDIMMSRKFNVGKKALAELLSEDNVL